LSDLGLDGHHVARCASRGNLAFVTSDPVAIRSMVRRHRPAFGIHR
jgi:hypothetical protein